MYDSSRYSSSDDGNTNVQNQNNNNVLSNIPILETIYIDKNCIKSNIGISHKNSTDSIQSDNYQSGTFRKGYSFSNTQNNFPLNQTEILSQSNFKNKEANATTNMYIGNINITINNHNNNYSSNNNNNRDNDNDNGTFISIGGQIDYQNNNLNLNENNNYNNSNYNNFNNNNNNYNNSNYNNFNNNNNNYNNSNYNNFNNNNKIESSNNQKYMYSFYGEPMNEIAARNFNWNNSKYKSNSSLYSP